MLIRLGKSKFHFGKQLYLIRPKLLIITNILVNPKSPICMGLIRDLKL